LLQRIVSGLFADGFGLAKDVRAINLPVHCSGLTSSIRTETDSSR
jgi:hypothetical protein